MGLGRHGGGIAAARFLVAQGALVTVTDTAREETLAASLEQIADLKLARLRLGGHDETDFSDTDIVVVNPAVRPNNSFVAVAKQAGATITSEIELFLERCRGQVIGVTGTCGKSTTASMIAEILRSDGRDVRLGGNIEQSLLSQLDDINHDTWCVLELSSFQLHWLGDVARRPDIAVITNFQLNHLDWHDSLDDYQKAKRRIIATQSPAPKQEAAPQQLFDPSAALGRATHDLSETIAELPPLHLPGKHNQENAALAALAASEIGCQESAIRDSLINFRPLPHRLETIADVAGRTFINDSQATTPDSTIAALEAVGPNVWLLAGGADKGSDLRAMARSIVSSTRGAAFFGQLGPQLLKLTQTERPEFNGRRFERLDKAFAWCFEQSEPGNTILLSPGCASLDQYSDYAARAAEFRRCVERMQGTDGLDDAAAEAIADSI